MAGAARDDSGSGPSGRRGRRSEGSDASGIAGRVPPHDLDAERSVLSSLLLDPRAFHDVALELRADDFYHPAHQAVYKVMLDEMPSRTGS